jgi:hypothetical protein
MREGRLICENQRVEDGDIVETPLELEESERRTLFSYMRLADRLKQAHRHVQSADVPVALRIGLTRQVLTITAAAKHDLADAARRLDRFLEELPRTLEAAAASGFVPGRVVPGRVVAEQGESSTGV